MSVQAMKQGAVDFLPKPVDRTQLLGAIQLALQKDTAARRECERRRQMQRRLEQLTEREREVMELVIRGWLNKQIAAELGIAEPTVKIHRGRVMDKLGVASVAELILLVQQAGLTIARANGPDTAAPAF
jgi:FixJ family two-component response regulator